MKRVPLRRKPFKRKTRKPLRKTSRTAMRRLINRADRALQDYFRRTLKPYTCENCGERAYAMHHFVPKSVCARLRFDEQNLIPICARCHTAHHLGGDTTIHAKIQKYRGIDWVNYILKAKQQTIQLDRPFLEHQLQRWQSTK